LSIHGLKIQTLDLPNGMTAFVYGYVAARESDLTLLEQSNLNGMLVALQFGEAFMLKALGDAIYPTLQCIGTTGTMSERTTEDRILKYGAKRVRVAVEWDYGDTASLYAIVNDPRQNKIFVSGGSNMKYVYFNSMLLKNMHHCLYGCTASRYFHCTPPSLESWMNGTD
jgi:hypothetical protein